MIPLWVDPLLQKGREDGPTRMAVTRYNWHGVACDYKMEQGPISRAIAPGRQVGVVVRRLPLGALSHCIGALILYVLVGKLSRTYDRVFSLAFLALGDTFDDYSASPSRGLDRERI